MGRIWGAANRAEGYRLGAEDGLFVLAIDAVIWTGHGVWRFFSGRPMLGDRKRKTHATWSNGSTKQLRSTDRPPCWWSRLAEKYRAAIRVGLLIIIIDIVWGWWDGPFASVTHGLFTIAGIAITQTGLYYMIKGIGKRFGDRRHGRGFLDPLRAGIGPIIGVAANEVKVRIPRRNVYREGK